MIEVGNLTKNYGEIRAVDNISFSVRDGTVCGFLGPNGAGKSTTMNIMTGCLSATEGIVKIGGYDIFEESEKAKKLIGYLPEQPPLYLDDTPREYLRFVAEAKGITRSLINDEITKVMEETDTVDVADRLIKHLSKGYRQRIGIAQTLIGNPPVIILDEPTVGLDPLQVIEIRELIRELGRKHTVIFSSHILSEVQQICDEIMIISKGRVMAYDTADNLEKLMQNKTRLELLTDADRDEIGAVFNEINGIEDAVYGEEDGLLKVSLEVSKNAEMYIRRELSLRLADIGKAVMGLSRTAASLEEIFLELTDPVNTANEMEEKDNGSGSKA